MTHPSAIRELVLPLRLAVEQALGRILRRAVLALFGLGLLGAAAGLGLAAVVIETAAHVGLAGALGLWAAVALLTGTCLVLLAGRRGGRSSGDGAGPSTSPDTVAGRPADPGQLAWSQGYAVGRCLRDRPHAALGLVLATAAAGFLAGRR